MVQQHNADRVLLGSHPPKKFPKRSHLLLSSSIFTLWHFHGLLTKSLWMRFFPHVCLFPFNHTELFPHVYSSGYENPTCALSSFPAQRKPVEGRNLGSCKNLHFRHAGENPKGPVGRFPCGKGRLVGMLASGCQKNVTWDYV